MIAWAKLELLSIKEHTNHFALKTRLYLKAVQAAFDELQKIKSYQLKLEDNPSHRKQQTTLLLE
jgi:hypothetical protein